MSRGFVVAVVGVLALAAAVFVSQRSSGAATERVHPPAPKPPAALQGTWLAKGVVESDRGGVDQPVGTKLTRRWVFFTRCSGVRCEPWLARESAGAVEQARVERPDLQLRVVFTRRTEGCNTARTGELTRTFRITTAATGGRLQASEAVRGVFPGCSADGGDGLTQSTLKWKLTKLSPACAGMPDCRQQQ